MEKCPKCGYAEERRFIDLDNKTQATVSTILHTFKDSLSEFEASVLRQAQQNKRVSSKQMPYLEKAIAKYAATPAPVANMSDEDLKNVF